MNYIINPYNKERFQEHFVKTDLYRYIVSNLDLLDKQYNYIKKTTSTGYTFDDSIKKHNLTLSPRFVEYLQFGVFSFSVFYYIEKLLEISPTKILDLGCGDNLFKIFIPNIHGVDFDQCIAADEHGYFGFEFCQKYKNYYEAAMAINSLHFINIDQIEQTIIDFSSLIKSKGRGFITFNLHTIKQHSYNNYSNEQLIESINNKLKKINLNFLIIDQVYDTYDNYINGNIRLVFEKD